MPASLNIKVNVMTTVFACELLDEKGFKELMPSMLKLVPFECATKVSKYAHTSDAQRNLIGEILARYALREITGISYNKPFYIGEKGKPYAENTGNVFFNISHSGNWVVVAVSDNPVGVDVEKMRKVPEGVAYRFFSEPEKQMLDKAEDDIEKAHIFFTLWTLKESFIKAIGKGLTKSLCSFTIIKNGEAGYELIPDAETSGFYLHSYTFQSDYKLAACSGDNDFDKTVRILNVIEMIASYDPTN